MYDHFENIATMLRSIALLPNPEAGYFQALPPEAKNFLAESNARTVKFIFIRTLYLAILHKGAGPVASQVHIIYFRLMCAEGNRRSKTSSTPQIPDGFPLKLSTLLQLAPFLYILFLRGVL